MRYGNFYEMGMGGLGQDAPLSFFGKIGQMTQDIVSGLMAKLPEIGVSTLTTLVQAKISEKLIGSPEAAPRPAPAPAPAPVARPQVLPEGPPVAALKPGLPSWVLPVGIVGALGVGFLALKGARGGK